MIIDDLRNELAAVRKASVAASQKGDFMKVARLTSKAAQLNKAIFDAENSTSFSDAQKATQDRPAKSSR